MVNSSTNNNVILNAEWVFLTIEERLHREPTSSFSVKTIRIFTTNLEAILAVDPHNRSAAATLTRGRKLLAEIALMEAGQ